ncbi:MAG: outer membrane lipoprotein-sorting protein [Phycisphaerae bacterium]
MRNILTTLTVLAAIAGTWAAPAGAQQTSENQMTVDQIVDRANYVSYYQGADGKAKVAMTIINKDGSQQSRQMTILRRDRQKEGDKQATDVDSDRKQLGRQKFYVYLTAPSSYNKMVFMVHKHLETEDDRWLYLPALDNVKRIAGKDKRTSFVGSHYVYEDVSGRNPDLDTHELIQTTDDYYVLKSTPKDKSLVEFDYYKTWIMRKDDVFLVVRTAWYKGDRKYRQYDVLKWDRISEQKYPTVLKSRMWDGDMGGQTVLQYSDIQFNQSLPEEIFTERYLRRTPSKYIE